MDFPHTPSERRRNTGEIVVGAIIVGMGLLLLGDRYLDRDLPLMRSWWPLLLIVMGAARLGNHDSGPDGRTRSRRSGVWLILVGVWAMASESHLFGLTFGTSWPLLIIAAGLMMVWRAVETASRPPLSREP